MGQNLGQTNRQTNRLTGSDVELRSANNNNPAYLEWGLGLSLWIISRCDGKVNIVGGTGLKGLWHYLETEYISKESHTGWNIVDIILLTCLTNSTSLFEQVNRAINLKVGNELEHSQSDRNDWNYSILQRCSQRQRSIGLTSHLFLHQFHYDRPPYQKEKTSLSWVVPSSGGRWVCM